MLNFFEYIKQLDLIVISHRISMALKGPFPLYTFKKVNKKTLYPNLSMNTWDCLYIVKVRQLGYVFWVMAWFRLFYILHRDHIIPLVKKPFLSREPSFILSLNFIRMGWYSIFKFFYFTFIGIFIIILYFYIQFAAETVTLFRLIFSWFAVGTIIYLLISGFIFFLKRYNYSKFTTLISRFWKRSFNVFWLVEGYLFLFFIYMVLNSSSEVVYFYDYQDLYKDNLYSFRFFFFKLLGITALITLQYYIIITGPFLRKISLFYLLVIMSGLVFSVFWIEFQQFFHFVSYYDYFFTQYDDEVQEWSQDNDFNQPRIIHNYILICIIAKFWHFIFVLIMWIFTVIRLIESPDMRYYLLSANLQNFLIIYLLNMIFFFSWIRFIGRKYLYISFNCFYEGWRDRGINYFFSGAVNVFFAICSF